MPADVQVTAGMQNCNHFRIQSSTSQFFGEQHVKRNAISSWNWAKKTEIIWISTLQMLPAQHDGTFHTERACVIVESKGKESLSDLSALLQAVAWYSFEISASVASQTQTFWIYKIWQKHCLSGISASYYYKCQEINVSNFHLFHYVTSYSFQ